MLIAFMLAGLAINATDKANKRQMENEKLKLQIELKKLETNERSR